MSRKPSNSAGDPSGTPTDLELMLYADGELEEDRIAAIEAYLDRSASARTKIRGLDLTSMLVREQAIASASKGDGLTDSIMARIAAEAATPAPVKLVPAQKLPLQGLAPAPRAKSANDNSRGIFTLAAIAFAAAAGLMIWGKTSLAPTPNAALAPKPAETTAAARPEPPAPAPAKTSEIAAENDDDQGVEVASVNFGSRTGSIFYVPKGVAASNATTTVVWLNDDVAGGE